MYNIKRNKEVLVLPGKRRGKGREGNPRGSVRVKRKLSDRQTDRGERVNRGAKKGREGKGREECRATGAGREGKGRERKDFDSLGKRVRRILF